MNGDEFGCMKSLNCLVHIALEAYWNEQRQTLGLPSKPLPNKYKNSILAECQSIDIENGSDWVAALHR